MPRLDYRYCRACGRHTDECGPLSHTRLCADDSAIRLVENVQQMIEHAGPNFDRWRRRMAASVGAVLPGDSPDAA